jgi:hypothetical protein
VGATVVVWHGNPAEQAALLQAVTRNCTCPQEDGLIHGSCPAHQALLSQRFIDGLLVEEFNRP